MHMVLEEIDAIGPPGIGNDWPHLPCCDFCCEDVSHDFRDGRDARLFYRMMPDDLIVCANCLPDVENPTIDKICLPNGVKTR